ncbi:MAG: hypothetical protein WCP39_02830 [Chlamydiota bacterium]
MSLISNVGFSSQPLLIKSPKELEDDDKMQKAMSSSEYALEHRMEIIQIISCRKKAGEDIFVIYLPFLPYHIQLNFM